MTPWRAALRPATAVPSLQCKARVALICLACSAVAIFATPLAMPSDYRWLAHTTSEAAGQGVVGAWLPRAGFLLFGVGVALLAGARRTTWARAVWALHLVFAYCMLAAAAFASKAWGEAPVYGRVEDFLHSAAATIMGFAFTLGVLLRLLQRRVQADESSGRVSLAASLVDVAAIAVATLCSLGMAALPDQRGLLQRAIFAGGYLWYAREAWTIGAAPQHDAG